MRYLIAVALLFRISAGSAQEMPQELLQGANAVILKEETVVTVEKLNRMNTQKYLRVAVLNQQGDEAFGTYSAYYNAFKKVKKIEAAAYSLSGDLLLKSKNSDIRDVALNPFDKGATDVRAKIISLDRRQLTFPYILEFRLEEESNETFFYEDWVPVRALHMGGWQSLPASQVAEKGYGDCKALTNYTIALLEEAGVKAYPALVNSGMQLWESEVEDFPSNAFDHIIACIPMARDTVWLECTSQTAPFGYLGSFTGNRKALLITEGSSRLVTTRTYLPEENSLASAVEVRLKGDGSSEISYQSLYTGIQQEEIYELAWGKDREMQKKWLKGRVRLSDVLVEDFRLEISDQGVKESVFFNAPAAGSFSGDRFFFQPYVISSFFPETAEVQREERSKAFYLNPNIFSFMDTDTVTWVLPEGFRVENVPKDVRLEAPFGFYESRLESREHGQLRYSRKVQIKGGLYPAEVYGQWVDFVRAVNRADRQRTVLRKM